MTSIAKTVFSVLCLSLGVMLGAIASIGGVHSASANLTCSDVTNCTGGDHCGGSGTYSNTCQLYCSDGGSVNCPQPK